MANPQKENGHLQISTELWEAWTRIRVNGEAEQVLKAIIRKTYGFNKKADAISLSQFILMTGIKKPNVQRALKKLQKLNIIIQKESPIAHIYSINKDFDTWKPLSKRIPHYPNGYRGGLQMDKKRYPKRVPQYTVSKDNITKDIATESPKDIVELLDFFKNTVNSHISFANKTERKACSDLLKAYGMEKVKAAMLFLEEKRKTDKYLPLITTPYELWTKWAKIKQHLTTKKRKIWKPTLASALSLPAQNTN